MDISSLSQTLATRANWSTILTSDFEHYVPQHWLQFEPVPCSNHFVLAIVYSVIFVPGFCGNVMLITLFFRVRTLRSPSNTISINLALGDLVMNMKIPFFIYNCLHCKPALGIKGKGTQGSSLSRLLYVRYPKKGCQIYGFVGGLSGTVAIVTITIMAVERYLTIKYPFKTKRLLTKSMAYLVSMVIWIYSLAFATPPLVGMVNAYVPEGFLTSCTFDYLSRGPGSRVFVAIFFVGAWLLPMILIVYSYVMIMHTVRQSGKQFRDGPSDVKGTAGHLGAVRCLSALSSNSTAKKARPSVRTTELRLARCALTLITLWTMAWTPYALVALVGIFGDQSLITPMTSMMPAVFAKLASILDPYVYGFSHPRYRQEIRTLFRKWLGRGPQPSPYDNKSKWSRFASFTVSKSMSHTGTRSPVSRSFSRSRSETGKKAKEEFV
ncbi:Opsin, ultraviolet-sensitive [Halotydeus destructor]|nr:Opsin, ultraviolet-sensitive [Halotydeus destructor]